MRKHRQYNVGIYERLSREDEQRTLLADEAVAEVVRRIFRLRAQGMGARSIASALNMEGIPPPSAYRGVYTRPQSETLSYKSTFALEQ